MGNVDELLRNLVHESNNQLPYRPNAVRQKLDFEIVPRMAYSDPCTFLHNCINHKETYLCDLFNSYYKKYNPIFYPNDPKIFAPGDFGVFIKEVSSGKRLIYISLPSEFMGSHAFCTAYVLTYEIDHEAVSNLKFFTIEDTSYDWKNIGIISPNLEHQRLTRPTGSMVDDINLIISYAFQ